MALLRFSNQKNKKVNKEQNNSDEDLTSKKNNDYNDTDILKKPSGYGLKKFDDFKDENEGKKEEEDDDNDDEEDDKKEGSGGGGGGWSKIDVEVNRASGKPSEKEKSRKITKEQKKQEKAKAKKLKKSLIKSPMFKTDIKKITKKHQKEAERVKTAFTFYRMYLMYRRRKLILKLIRKLKALIRARMAGRASFLQNIRIKRTVAKLKNNIKMNGSSTFTERYLIKKAKASRKRKKQVRGR